MSDDKRLHAMKSLSSLARFLGIYEVWGRMVKNYGLRWNGKSSDDIIIERLTKTANPNDVYEWIKAVKETCAELSDFVDFMAITGLRFVESIESYNLIIKLSKHEKLSEYYDVEREILQHFKFREIFLRKTKKAFISFVYSDTVGKISENTPLTEDIIHGRLKRRNIPLRFSDIRELHGTLLTKHLRQPEIDFLHGRVSPTVFMRNYFNPTWITDLKARTFRAIREIEKATRNS